MSTTASQPGTNIDPRVVCFVRNLITLFCEKNGLRIKWSPPCPGALSDGLTGFEITREFSRFEFPLLPYSLPHFDSGIRVELERSATPVLSFRPYHAPADPGGVSTGASLASTVNLVAAEGASPEAGPLDLGRLANELQTAMAMAIRADENGLAKFRRPPFTCRLLELGSSFSVVRADGRQT